MGSINVSGFVDESRSNTRLSLNLRWFFLWLFFFYGIVFYLLVNVIVDQHLLQLIIQFCNCHLQIQVLILYGFHLTCQGRVCRSQLSYLMFETLNFELLADLQVKNVEGILCSGCQLCSSYISSVPSWMCSYVFLML